MATTDASSLSARMERIESLIQRIEESPDAATRETTREIVRALLDLHAAGLRKILESLSGANGSAQATVEAWVQDDLLRSLLILHDLHPASLQQRVEQALEQVRPYLRSHGGNVELLEVSPSGVRLRLEGSCHGCPSSSATMQDTIEHAIREWAPDALAIEVEGVASSPPNLVSLELPNSVNPGSESVCGRGPALQHQES